MDGYMQDPATLTDDQVKAWVTNFRDQPPTMDYMSEWSWAGRVMSEAKKRGL